jgi:hypothetical protein
MLIKSEWNKILAILVAMRILAANLKYVNLPVEEGQVSQTGD